MRSVIHRDPHRSTEDSTGKNPKRGNFYINHGKAENLVRPWAEVHGSSQGVSLLASGPQSS